jgi:hypothetical protein
MKMIKRFWHNIIDAYIIAALLPAFLLTAESKEQTMADWLKNRISE